MSTSYLTGEMDFMDLTAEANPSFSLPQQGTSSATFTPFSEAMSVWRKELCELQRSARIRNSQSRTDQTAQTPARCSHETNIDAHQSGSRTGHIFATRNEDVHGAHWVLDSCCSANQVLEQKWVAPERQFKEGVSQHDSSTPIEFAAPAYASENKESIQDPTKVAVHLHEKDAEDCNARGRVAELEMQNQQLAFELQRQKQTTEALLRQLDHFTSKSYSSKSVSENNFRRKMMRE